MEHIVNKYAKEVSKLASSETTTEETYYPAIKTLLSDLLKAQKLPFEVRTGTREKRTGGGADLPDVALYDGSGDFVVALCEVKLPNTEIEAMAVSTDRNNQIGRYLAQTRVVLLCNVRAFGLLTLSPSFQGTVPAPSTHRRLEQVVELWPSFSSLKKGRGIPTQAIEDLAELVETAVMRYAPIAEPESLARILARQARRAKADLPDKFSQAVKGLLDDFGKALGITFVSQEGDEFFRSSLIQTVFYGLFASWALWRHSETEKEFHWEDLSQYLKIPFLGELFHEFRHPRRIKELGLRKHLDLATETLHRVSVDGFFEKFKLPGIRHSEDDSEKAVTATAIMYFYEPFLEAFDPELRKELGVWYTPPEIVQYQVRKVDQILREELGCERGFAEENIVVLDPCCGTGAYLIEVLRCIAEQLEKEGVGAMVGETLLDVFCRRIIGFEVLTAPFVIAQLQLYLILSDLGAEPREGQRPAVFLTNALTGWKGPDQLKLNFPELQEEHDAAQKIKTDAKIIVILGNPPYNRFVGAPVEEEAKLVDPYKGIRRDSKGRQIGKSELYTRWGIRKHLLNELYIRFFRLAEEQIGEKAEYGVVSFISNYSFYTGRSHPIMRNSLLRNFHIVWADSLNGDKYRTGKVIPKGLPGEGTADQSIFTTEHDPRGIQVGTGITTLLKRRRRGNDPEIGTVYYREFWGLSVRKRKALLDSIIMHKWSDDERTEAAAKPHGPREYEKFLPTEQNRWKLIPKQTKGGFEEWVALDELFPVAFQGVNPNRGLEGSIVDVDKTALRERMQEYYSDLSYQQLRERHPVLCTPRARYDPRTIREKVNRISKFHEDHIVPYVLFPLDSRWLYYETEAKLLNERRPGLWENRKGNEFLITVPQPRRYSEIRPLLVTSLFDLHLHDRGSVGFPAEIRPNPSDIDLFSTEKEKQQNACANIAKPAGETLKKHWQLKGDIHGSSAQGLVRDIFRLCLTICHALQYEEEHKDSLAQDWVHIPIPKDESMFKETVEIGHAIAILLDPLAEAVGVIKTALGRDAATLAVVRCVGGGSVRQEDLVIEYSYYGPAKGKWGERTPHKEEAFRECWGERTGDLFLNEDVFFRHVPEKIWGYELGGYPVLKKWLGYRHAKRRNGAPLTLEEVNHFRSMVQRLAALLVLRNKMNALYEQVATDCFTAEELGLR